MPDDNADQIAYWNGPQGERWATLQRETERIVVAFGDAALKAAAPQPGERVIDVGCGCGDTSIALARSVGTGGAVLGIDISRPMLEVARRLGAAERLPQLAFAEADASAAELPAGCDLLFSRFGVMFFDRPAPAFAHLRRALRAGGRSVFVCWRTPRDNPWSMVPLAAARTAMAVTPPPADLTLPGPFALSDEVRLRAILADAGWVDVGLERFDASVMLGATPQEATDNALRVGPVSRFVGEVGAEHLPVIRAAVEQALVAAAGPGGQVRLNGSTWIVSATNPG